MVGKLWFMGDVGNSKHCGGCAQVLVKNGQTADGTLAMELPIMLFLQRSKTP